MEEIQFNFSRICRTCKMESQHMQSLFDESGNTGQKTRVHEMLMACASVQIDTEDSLPKVMCEVCVQKLENAYVFKKQCETVDQALREVLRSSKNVPVKEELFISQVDQDILNNIFNTTNTQDYDVSSQTSSVKMKNDFGIPEDNLVPEVVMQDQTSKSDFIEFLENNQLMLTCRACNKVFTTLDGLKCHKRVHTGNLFKCKTCDKEYIRFNHLQRHELSHGRRKIHVCKICNKTLNRFEHLKRHLITHLKEKPFSCASCNRGFNRTEHLLNHMRRCKGDRVHICDICNKAFNREDSLEVHKRIHENRMPVLPTLDNLDNIDQHYYEIDCDETTFPAYSDSDGDGEEVDGFPSLGESEDNSKCNQDMVMEDQVLEQEENLLSMETDVKEDIEELNNRLCEQVQEESEREQFAEIGKLEIHNEEQNETFEDEGGEFDEPGGGDSDSGQSEYLPAKPAVKVKRGRGRPRKDSSQKPPTKKGRHSKLKQNAASLESDLEEEDEGEYTCSNCSKVFKKNSQLEKHKEKCGEDQDGFKCEVCKKEFTRSNHLKRHMASHSGSKPFVCEVCPKSFTRKDHLSKHMNLHTRLKEYECEICKKDFYKPELLAKHKILKHNVGDKSPAEKKYQCNICMKSFTTEKYRDMHMKGHMGEKKFQCKTCDKCFLSKSHLTEHMKFHNDNSKKFLCSECGQRFIRNDYLVIHMRRHRGEKPFKCKFCGKGFPRTTDLTVHERYHTGEKTHLCTICGRGFGRAYNLTVHMRTHTGEKPYQCTYCDAAFAQGNDLKAHIRRHTGERFHCDLCSETFLMGYLLTQHKRNVHGLNIVSNIRRLQPVKQNPDDPPPIMVPLPQPVVPATMLASQIQAQLAAVPMHHLATE